MVNGKWQMVNGRDSAIEEIKNDKCKKVIYTNHSLLGSLGCVPENKGFKLISKQKGL
jgi:hypothetical protein